MDFNETLDEHKTHFIDMHIVHHSSFQGQIIRGKVGTVVSFA